MHFVKKMMTVVIMLMAGLSSEGWCAAIAATCVDFPLVETPGHKGFVTATHNPNHVFPDKNIPLANDGDNFTWIQVPNANNANIYFPVDGRQPTTQEAAEWSCANIGANNPNAPVTEWYMRMFGWTDPTVRGQVPLQMGFAPLAAGGVGPAPQNPKEIITLHDTGAGRVHDMDNRFTGIANPAGGFFDRREAFWHTFRQIAANPVGRVLLYRLLIEIRRQNVGNGHEEASVGTRSRNNARSLLIQYGATADDWSNLPAKDISSSLITVNFDDPPPLVNPPSDTLATTTSAANPAADGTCYTVSVHPYSLVCALFHEALHWYQQLRDELRFDFECCKPYSEIVNNDLSVCFGYPHSAVLPHFESWSDWRVSIDELRVICGNEAGGACPYFEGDDLSENALRCSLGLKMRFGHGNAIPVANNEVDNAIRVAHRFALSCVQNIIGHPPLNWALTKGQALHP